MFLHNHGMGVRVAATMMAVFVCLCAIPTSAAVDACTQTTPLTGGSSVTKDGTGNVGGGYEYELWHDGAGSMTMTNYGKNAAFKASWKDAGDFLARVGLKWNETKTYDAYGNVAADYAFTKSGSGGGYSFIGIYGWSNNPLVEYYIVEDWFGSGPPTGGGTLKGSFDIDGGTYKIYTNLRDQKPSIHGTATFTQFFSVRQKARQCGHISISEHWKKWASLNMQLGKMYESKILVEAGGGQGTFDLSYATLQANIPASVLPSQETVPEISRTGGVSWNNGKSGTLTLVSLNGTVVRSAQQSESKPAVVSTGNLARGLYLLRFQGSGAAPETRKLLLDK